jgi:hypothetical protein
MVNSVSAQQLVPSIGQWREHLPYNSAIDVTAGNNKIYAATPYSIFTVDLSDNSIERWSRVTGLSETGISHLLFDVVNNKLVIAYANSNIDILQGLDIYNIPDIKRATVSGDKKINAIYASGKNYYLSTGIGIIVLDGDRYQVKETWIIGSGGNPGKVNAFSSDGSYYYAATENGLRKAPVSGVNLSDPQNWISVQGNVLNQGNVRNVFNINGKMFAEKNDSLFVQTVPNWDLVYTDGWPFVNTSNSENKIVIPERQSNGQARIVQLNNDGSTARIISNTGAVSYPRKAIIYKNETWVADQYEALSAFGPSNNYRSYKLNSPQSVASGELIVSNDVFYATAGSVNDSWNYLYNGDGIFKLKEGQWTNINRYQYAKLDSLLDFITIAVDKRDQSAWAGSFGGGLLHIKEGPIFDIFKQGYLGVTVGDPGSYRVAGLAFDRENNLWISNYGSSQQLKVRKADGSWRGFTVPPPLYDNALAQIIIDDNNYKWIVAPQGNGLVCFDHGNGIDNSGDDRWKRITAGAGNGNLPSNEVFCIEKDKNGFIWVGTADGIGVIECPQETFTGRGCEAVWPIVPNGNFAGYLFKGQEIRSIIADGANRKWVATKAGVFLVSPDGQQVIYHFTEDNSPLLNNDVRKITINGKNGEVFFATANGICSFRSTATEPEAGNDNLLVFPNPVPAGYGGTIGIRGLPANAIVKITELDGRLVYQVRGLGGQATWDGRNYRGQKIASGAYLVLVRSDDGKEKLAGKIFFIQK